MKNPKLTRRNFLKLSSATALPLTMSGFPLYYHNQPGFNLFGPDNDKVLVLVQLQGGNDGLNTIYDAHQYANLNAVRNNIIVSESDLLQFSDNYSFHPAMIGLEELWGRERVGIIQNVGYPNQNRSHFRSTDIWNTASSAEEYVNSGWIGRYFDLNYSDYPMGFPNDDCPHPFALTMGKIISETCQGIDANYSLALSDPFNPGMALVGAEGDLPDNCLGDVLSFVNDTVTQTNAYAQSIRDAAEAGNNLSSKYEGLSTALSAKLKDVARLISGGLQTKIYVVQLGGFDTHDNQVVDGDPSSGIHANLLKEFSDAICAFQDDLGLLGLEERVMGMTYSEFGRRIRSNAGLGTDHGTAAPMLLFGSCVKNQILGDAPIIDRQVSIDEGVPMQFDFREVYATVLTDWLGINPNSTKKVLFEEFNLLPLIEEDCIDFSTFTRHEDVDDLDVQISPNPTSEGVTINFLGVGAYMTITLYNSIGGVVSKIPKRYYRKEGYSIELDLPQSGSRSVYFIHLSSNGQSLTKRIVKL